MKKTHRFLKQRKNAWCAVFFVLLSSEYFFVVSEKVFATEASPEILAQIIEQNAKAEATAQAEAQALKEKIAQKNADLSQIQNQIDTYTKWLNSAQGESKTLQGAIKTLDVERQKMNANINLTQNKLYKTTLSIRELDLNISETESKIKMETNAIAEVMRSTDMADSQSLLEMVLSQNKFSAILDDVIQLGQLRSKISEQVGLLQKYKADSLDQKKQKEIEGKKLVGYKAELIDQKVLLDKAKQEKNDVLLATKNRESAYQKILDDNMTRKNALEKDLAAYENQLTRTLSVSSIPKAGTGALLWPLDLPRITQRFGVTKDSVRLYASGSHNGLDLGASRGTRVTSPATGTVIGTGDTDVACPKASYGKWVLIKHDNGLTTLMAHFDLIKVVQGQTVGAGELIGYSGNTGYSTGPHLHISVFASDGVTVGTLPSKSCSGRTFTMPLPTATNAYLDPEIYFPKI